MRLRSMLFVPGDSERKFAKACCAGGDALILDLEDAVAPTNKTKARDHVASIIDEGPRDWRFFVRVNPFDTGLTLQDLAAVVRPGLDGIVVPKADGGADVTRIGYYLDAFEQAAGMVLGTVKIAVVATETPAAMFGLASYAPAHSRLVALTWGAEDLGAAVGATANKAGGSWTHPYQLARSQCLFAAAAAQIVALDTIYADFRDPEGLAEDCRIARRDGFVGRLAIHPDQISTINACFAASEADLAHARRIVDAFAADPSAGTIGIDGKMYDIPHLKMAWRILDSVA